MMAGAGTLMAFAPSVDTDVKEESFGMTFPQPHLYSTTSEFEMESSFTSFNVTPDRGAVREVRRRVMEFARTLPFSKEELNSIEIAVGEAAANAVRHGSPLGPSDHFTVRCEYVGGTFTVEIIDQGGGFAPSMVPAPVAEDLKTNGYGLCLMNGLMDEVKFDFTPDGGTIARLTKKVRPVQV